MGKVLYIDGSFGISGDMLCGALLDLGASREKVMETLGKLPVQGFKVEIGQVKKAGLAACDFNVILDHEHENHDHDMEYLHGHEHHHHHHEHEHHHHEHHHEHEHEHHHHHEHRKLADVLEIIDKADISDNACNIATRIFTILGEAEAKAHGSTLQEVHFHEVGAVDSIVDILTIAICVDDLGAEDIVVRNLTDGTGTIRCQHGIMPVPVPAVANIVSQQKLHLHISDVQGELVTPTGAASVAALKTSAALPDNYIIEKIGIGAGKRSYSVPSILRVMLLDVAEEETSDSVVKLETNIDDTTGENLGYVMGLLMEAGAKDVYYTPIFMKKNRPAYTLNVICKEENRTSLENIIFKETTTIGIRRTEYKRTILERETAVVGTEWGQFKVKVCTLPTGEMKCYPEYESVKEMCQKSGKNFQECYLHLQGILS